MPIFQPLSATLGRWATPKHCGGLRIFMRNITKPGCYAPVLSSWNPVILWYHIFLNLRYFSLQGRYHENYRDQNNGLRYFHFQAPRIIAILVLYRTKINLAGSRKSGRFSGRSVLLSYRNLYRKRSEKPLINRSNQQPFKGGNQLKCNILLLL